jgi:hypothetical protein
MEPHTSTIDRSSQVFSNNPHLETYKQGIKKDSLLMTFWSNLCVASGSYRSSCCKSTVTIWKNRINCDECHKDV